MSHLRQCHYHLLYPDSKGICLIDSSKVGNPGNNTVGNRTREGNCLLFLFRHSEGSASYRSPNISIECQFVQLSPDPGKHSSRPKSESDRRYVPINITTVPRHTPTNINRFIPVPVVWAFQYDQHHLLC
jgi:hypothetical protein